MAQPELDWTFAPIPADEAPETARAGGPRAPRRTPRPPMSRRRRLLWLGGLLGAAALLAGVAYGFYAVGWQRVRAQLAREIAYEDEQALAGNIAAVRAVQAPDAADWQNQRAAEVRLGYAAYPPAADLMPTGVPAAILDVRALEGGVVEVSVARDYADSAGQVYAFEYVQRYRGQGAGLWVRLPPPETPAAALSVWHGQRLTAELPPADLPWLGRALPQIDALLVAACEHWQCPSDMLVPVTFAGTVDELPRLSAARRPTAAEGHAGAYPAAFDLPFVTPRYPSRVILPAPSLGGRPRGAEAEAALVRSITVQLLAYVATDLAGTNRGINSHYFDALIAREEIRLGLSPTPRWRPTVHTLENPLDLWHWPGQVANSAGRPNVVQRLAALDFLNYALAGSPPEADARLLAEIRPQVTLARWLADVAGLNNTEALAGTWLDEKAGILRGGRAPNWPALEGLQYMCGGQHWLVRQGAPRSLPAVPGMEAPRGWTLPALASADGRRIALTTNELRLYVLEAAGQSATLVGEPPTWPFGWTAQGELLYGQVVDPNFGTLALVLFDPDTGTQQILDTPSPILAWWFTGWTSNHTAVGLNLAEGIDSSEPSLRPGVITLSPTVRFVAFEAAGYGAVVSPDGQRVAYFGGRMPWEDRPGLMTIEVAGVASGQVMASVSLGPEPEIDITGGFQLAWAGHGQALALVGLPANSPDGKQVVYVVDVPRDGPPGPLRAVGEPGSSPLLVGLSADGAYVATLDYSEFERANRANLRLAIAPVQPGAPGGIVISALGAAWAPTGHRLAIAGPNGVYILDAATGEYEWITDGECAVYWHALR